MVVEHIIWDDDPSGDCVYGLCHVDIYYHGDDRPYTVLALGHFEYDQDGNGKFSERFLGSISKDTVGVSFVKLVRVGRVVP